MSRNPNFAVGLSNPSLKSGINVRIEITAVVGKIDSPFIIRLDKAANRFFKRVFVVGKDTEREAFFQKFQSSFEGKLTPSVSEVSMCILSKVMKEFTPQEFNTKAKGEQDVLISWMKKDCYTETKNESLEKRMSELEETKLKINELEKKGDFTTMAAVAERLALEFPNAAIQSRHFRALLLSNQLSKAQTLGENLAKNNKDNLIIQSNLAHVYLLSNQYKEAEKLYLKFQKQQLTEGGTWEQLIASDFDFFCQKQDF